MIFSEFRAARFVRTHVPADEIAQCFEVPPPKLHDLPLLAG
jgi:hypothetical protein